MELRAWSFSCTFTLYSSISDPLYCYVLVDEIQFNIILGFRFKKVVFFTRAYVSLVIIKNNFVVENAYFDIQSRMRRYIDEYFFFYDKYM